ncbi:uncharacterized protein LOC110269273 [Arachis ipaensis]|uniref:uncharacterized protein LOC110269273 n=1 Tax=Arachis ipaensis TaxID=130454 RepID=UPI000A2B3892|nr:uncharacterized protein LOC110269273 [Arachis ipaensis]XP_025636223.1 uncharacterized protein LOC112730347 [Arachis hypogaea]
MGHRRFLNRDHRYRHDRSRFDDKVDDRSPSTKLTGRDVLRQLEGVHVSQGKVQAVGDKRRRGQQTVVQDESPWKKRNVFFDLPYWENNELRYNLDVMHIEKNVLRQHCLNHVERERKSIDPQQLPLLPDRVVHTLCHMEMIFPPSFLTVMVHLTVYLVEEVRLGGLVHYWWMYPIERYLCRLKQYVRNRAQPEGSIAEGYLSEEILTFCSRYLDNVETRINRPTRIDDWPSDAPPSKIANMFPEVGKAVEAASFFTLTATEKLQAHRHVLVNYIAVEKFLEAVTKRKLRNKTRSQSQIDSVVHREFFNWFRHEVPFGSTNHSNELQWLACGPLAQARRYRAYNVNGFKFRTMSREEGMKTQNSRVYVTSDTKSYASKRDANVAVGDVSYYGRLVDIIELNYSGQFTIVLFKCLWADTTSGRGIRQDVLGHTCVNFATPIHTGDHEDDESYILASEARLVFYVEDEVENGWSVVVHVKPRDLFDMGEDYEHCLRLTRDGDLEESTNDGVEDCDEAADS